MPLETWWKMTPEQLVELRHSLSAGTPDAITVDRMLELHFARWQTEGNAKLLASTDKLVAATHRLGTVTWWLVGGTILLGVSATMDFVFKLIKGMH